MTVIVRSPRLSPYTHPRRVGAGRLAAWTVTPSAVRRSIERRAWASSPSAVKKSQPPARRAIWTAATAPPPAGSERTGVASTISPASGTRSTRTNSHHSKWPITATRTTVTLMHGGRTAHRARPDERRGRRPRGQRGQGRGDGRARTRSRGQPRRLPRVDPDRVPAGGPPPETRLP